MEHILDKWRFDTWICWITDWTSELFDYYISITRKIFSFYYNESISNMVSDMHNDYLYQLLFVLSDHWFIWFRNFSLPFSEQILLTNNIYLYILSFVPIYLFAIFIWIVLDVIFYFIWKFLSNKLFFKSISKLNYPKFFYIFFRFIPILWNISVLIWSTLSKEHDFKDDFKKLIIWNSLFIFVNILLWTIVFILCGIYTY